MCRVEKQSTVHITPEVFFCAMVLLDESTIFDILLFIGVLVTALLVRESLVIEYSISPRVDTSPLFSM